ncbi:MAG: TetR/AcrR family transcriptional regulator [Prolixibacteraceae bacterium]|jgi:AcrR family transcriptional regulator|nr:TetR/AcrR family transcriptional regulator [Prolixibacteraceae bacterium]
MPKTKEQNQEIRRNRKQQIIEAAYKLFAEKSPAEVSIAMIAKEAGVSKGLMYSYFTNKEALQEEILNQTMDQIISLFMIDGKTINGPEDFSRRVVRLFTHVQNNIRTWRIYTQVALLPSMSRFFYSEKIQVMMECYQKQLSEYLVSQGFDDPLKEIVVIGALIDGASIQYVSAPEFVDINIIRNHIIDVYGKTKN